MHRSKALTFGSVHYHSMEGTAEGGIIKLASPRIMVLQHQGLKRALEFADVKIL